MKFLLLLTLFSAFFCSFLSDGEARTDEEIVDVSNKNLFDLKQRRAKELFERNLEKETKKTSPEEITEYVDRLKTEGTAAQAPSLIGAKRVCFNYSFDRRISL